MPRTHGRKKPSVPTFKSSKPRIDVLAEDGASTASQRIAKTKTEAGPSNLKLSDLLDGLALGKQKQEAEMRASTLSAQGYALSNRGGKLC